MKKRTYTKSPAWHAHTFQQRKANGYRNIQIYRDMTENYTPQDWKRVADKHHLTRQRLHIIKAQVQKMIDRGEVDLDFV